METASFSVTAKAPLSKQQQYWRARRRRRVERLPSMMAICAGLFFCLAGLAEWGYLDSFKTPSTEVGDDFRGGFGSLAASASLTSSGRDLSSPWRRELRADTMIDIAGIGMVNLSSLACPVSGNDSSVNPSFAFESDRGAAMLFFVVVTLYMFLGLAIVCDSFFESSLSAICEALSLKDDVAGATFMAAGGSAPELATSIIGVFFSKSDIGFGTIVGSAVFNVLFVIACCAFVAPNLKLTWWPLARDASYYCFSLALIVIFVSNDLAISWLESLVLLLAYVGYVAIMYFNERLEIWVTHRIKINSQEGSPIQQMLLKLVEHPLFALLLYGAILSNTIMVILEIVEFNRRAAELPCKCGVNVGAAKLQPLTYAYLNLGFNIFFILEMLTKFYAYGFFGYWKVPLNCFDGALVFLIVVELLLTESARSAGQESEDPTADANDQIGVGIARMLRLLKFVRFIRTVRLLRLSRFTIRQSTVAPDAEQEAEEGAKTRVEEGTNGEDKQIKEGAEEPAEEGGEEEDDDDEPFNPFEPWGDFSSLGGLFGRTMWFIGLPLCIMFFFTIPDCRRPMFAKFWYLTFSMCIFWVAALSYVMVWMVERIGVMYEVPTSIMGIFVLAAGTSIPDCLSSIAVARRGHGDMAVSSSIGSNIFDVLIGLPVPWFIYTAILRPAGGPEVGPEMVPVQSEALAVMILLLFVMVALVITIIHMSGWILSIRLGGYMMFLYFIFLVLALLLDRKVIFADCIDDVF